MDFSRRTIIGGGVALATLASASPARVRTGNPSFGIAKAIDDGIAATIAAGASPGAQISITRRGTAIFSKGYGLANLETRTAATNTSIMRIGSLTKQFVAAAIVKLAAEGKVRLADPASKYLPFLGSLKTFSLAELMHHTAGVHSDESDAAAAAAPAATSQIDLARGIAAQSTLFDFEPGTAWLYSNANYILLGAIIEAIAGVPLADAMAAALFRPLGLLDTAFDNSTFVVPGRASGYSAVEGKKGTYTNASWIEISQAGGAGAMRSTATDLCKWHQSLLGGQLFGPEHVQLMLAPGRLRDGRLSGSNRFSAADASYGDVQYAGGLLVSPPTEPKRTILHFGAINGFACVLETYLDQELTIAILCNGDIGPDMPFRPIRRAVAKMLAA